MRQAQPEHKEEAVVRSPLRSRQPPQWTQQPRRPSSKGEKGQFIPLDKEEREQAIVEIQKIIPSFDYDALLGQLKDREVLKAKFEDTNVGYEKVQIFRIASALDPDAPGGDAAFKKFVNESYHIENEYVMQLNPREFDAVPEHVVQACAGLLE